MRARVYKNLNNGKWSIKQKIGGKWIVVGHAAEVGLINVASFVSDKRHDYVRSGNHREVFAWLEGELHMVKGFVPFKGRSYTLETEAIDYGWDSDDLSRLTFHPFSEVKQGFHWVFDGDDMDYAYRCYFDADAKVWGYV